MDILERALQWVRRLVETRAWDYCIVWKFGDDPSRFVEWKGCCCVGGYDACKNVREENQHSLVLCKDTHLKHSLRTDACERLAKIPSSIPLYSGIHGEVAMSSQPRWINHESNKTQVLIPAAGGIIEFFSGNQVPKDEKFMDYLVSHLNNFGNHKKTWDLFIKEESKFTPKSNPDYSLQFVSRESHSKTCPFPEGSSVGSNPSNEHSSFGPSSGHVSPNQSIGNTNSLGCSDFGRQKTQTKQRKGKGPFQSKNLIHERNRRSRINSGILTLRALVPKISKMDKASTLGDAIEYIRELQTDVKGLKDELSKLAEEDYNYGSVEVVELAERKRASKDAKISPDACGNGGVTDSKQIEAEVAEIGAGVFVVRFVCRKTQGGFRRMLEAVESLGLVVIDANVTTCHGMVLNMLKVQASRQGMEPNYLKDSLLARWSSWK